MALPLRYDSTSEPTVQRVARARIGVLVLFFSMGILLSTFLSRVPTLRDQLGVTKGQLANLLIAGAGGAFVALLITGWAAARFGTRALLWWSAIAYTVVFAVVGVAANFGMPLVFAAGQFLVSFCFAFANVSMNAEAALVEQRTERNIMPQFHAAFSVGMAIGLAVGAAFSHWGVVPMWHFLSVSVALMVVRLGVIPLAVMDGRPAEDAKTGLGGPFATAKAEYRDRRVIMIGFIVFAASMTEGSAAQWVALAGVDDFHRPESTGDLMYWVFVVAMVTIRGTGARWLEKFGRVMMLRISAVSVITGILLFAFAPVFWLVLVGLMLWGMGAALGVPIGFSAAADEPKRAAARVAAVSSFATIAGLVVPQLIGHLAEVVTLRYALLVVIAASITSFALARAVRKDGPLWRRHSPRKADRDAARLAAQAQPAIEGAATLNA